MNSALIAMWDSFIDPPKFWGEYMCQANNHLQWWHPWSNRSDIHS